MLLFLYNFVFDWTISYMFQPINLLTTIQVEMHICIFSPNIVHSIGESWLFHLSLLIVVFCAVLMFILCLTNKANIFQHTASVV